MLKASGHQHIRTILLHKLQHPSQEELLKYSNYLNVFQQFFYVYHQTGIEGFIPWFSSFHVRPLRYKTKLLHGMYRTQVRHGKIKIRVIHSPKFIPIQIGIPSWIPNWGWNSNLNTDSNWDSKLSSWSVGRVYVCLRGNTSMSSAM